MSSVKWCQECNNANPERRSVCKYCGAVLPQAEEIVTDAKFKFCMACGRKVAPNVKFCAGCGAEFSAKERSVQFRTPKGLVSLQLRCLLTKNIWQAGQTITSNVKYSTITIPEVGFSSKIVTCPICNQQLMIQTYMRRATSLSLSGSMKFVCIKNVSLKRHVDFGPQPSLLIPSARVYLSEYTGHGLSEGGKVEVQETILIRECPDHGCYISYNKCCPTCGNKHPITKKHKLRKILSDRERKRLHFLQEAKQHGLPIALEESI